MPSPVVLFEDSLWQRFLPLVYFRGLFQLRCGVGELWQRVERVATRDAVEVALWGRPEIADLAAEQTGRMTNVSCEQGGLLLNARGFWRNLPTYDERDSWIGSVGADQQIACICADDQLAQRLSPEVMLDADRLQESVEELPRRDVSHLVTMFDWPWEVVHFNLKAIDSDWRLAGLRGTSPASPGVFHINPEQIHIGAGSRVKPCVVIDAEDGPVWIGANVTVQPHSYIQGPCYIGNNSLIQPGAVIHEGCSFGPRCKIGGEVEASIVQGFSNKQHNGFLGHAYLGEWINMGADCLNSDLKNTYGTVRVPINGREVETNQQFVGMLMGDFAKTGINVAFSTGAVVGACSNIVVSSPPKFVPSVTWLDANGQQPFDVDRALNSAGKMMARRGRTVTPALESAIRSLPDRAGGVEAFDKS